MSGLLLKDYFWSANAPSVSDELVKFGDVVLLNNERQVAETTGLDDDLELYMVLFVTLLEAKRPAAANRNFAYVAMFPVKVKLNEPTTINRFLKNRTNIDRLWKTTPEKKRILPKTSSCQMLNLNNHP